MDYGEYDAFYLKLGSVLMQRMVHDLVPFGVVVKMFWRIMQWLTNNMVQYMPWCTSDPKFSADNYSMQCLW